MAEHVRRLLQVAHDRGETHLEDVVFTTDALLAAFSPPLLAYQRRELGFTVGRVIRGVTTLFITNLEHAVPTPAPQDELEQNNQRHSRRITLAERFERSVTTATHPTPAHAHTFSQEDLAYFEKLRQSGKHS